MANIQSAVRGKTPENIEKRCLSLCQDYIGGQHWSTATLDDISVTRITGGLTNQLYRVQLKTTTINSEIQCNLTKEPTDVAIKLYLKKHLLCVEDDERLNDNIILTIMSQRKLGPQVYGIFADGNIQAFHEHEHFGKAYHKDPEMINKLCNNLAQINHLNVPIRKNKFLMKQIAEFLQIGYSNPTISELMSKLDLPNLKSRDLRDELACLTKIIAKQAAPIVFNHNDLTGSNIMIVGKEKKILVIDLEYCNYGERGFDLAMILTQHGKDAFEYFDLELPEDIVLVQYLQYYIDACDEIVPGYSKVPKNSLEDHLKEVKVATLQYMMVLMSFFIKQKESFLDTGKPVNFEKILKIVENFYRIYNETKQRAIKDGTITDF